MAISHFAMFNFCTATNVTFPTLKVVSTKLLVCNETFNEDCTLLYKCTNESVSTTGSLPGKLHADAKPNTDLTYLLNFVI